MEEDPSRAKIAQDLVVVHRRLSTSPSCRTGFVGHPSKRCYRRCLDIPDLEREAWIDRRGRSNDWRCEILRSVVDQLRYGPHGDRWEDHEVDGWQRIVRRWDFQREGHRNDEYREDLYFQWIGPHCGVYWLNIESGIFFDIMEIPEDRQVNLAFIKFKYEAAAWWDRTVSTRARLPKRPVKTWENMKSLLRAQFLSADFQRVQYQNCRQESRNMLD